MGIVLLNNKWYKKKKCSPIVEKSIKIVSLKKTALPSLSELAYPCLMIIQEGGHLRR